MLVFSDDYVYLLSEYNVIPYHSNNLVALPSHL